MKTLSVVCLVLGSFCHGILSSPASAQNKPTACVLTIQTPQSGDTVGKDGKVRGMAKIPTDSFLWILTHVKDLRGKWWPQNDGPLVIDEAGSWVTRTAYGVEDDIGDQFEVAVVVVGPGANALLMNWFKNAKQIHEYPPMALPSTIDGCPPLIVTVTKVTHERPR